MRESQHQESELYTGEHGEFIIDGYRVSFSDLLATTDSSPSTDDDVAAGAFHGDNNWFRPEFIPVSTSGAFLNSPPVVSLPSPQIPVSMPYQHYPSSSSTFPNYYDQTTTKQQLSSIENNLRFALSESHKEKRLGKPKDDGYNWRKYGQKPIKDCKFSRSYYKCTHPNCPVKKKVEHAITGRITQIIYKGHHSHEPPQSGKRANRVKNEIIDSVDAYMRFDEDEDDDDDHVACVRARATYEEDESNELTVTEPKIVVQTTSDVDLLDDGYRWRKYGQKVVKGNHNPRSYYKCTSEGCKVRKQVERSSKQREDVITTYDGKHNHSVPLGRNNIDNRLAVSNAVPKLKEEQEFV